jgi:hypothetical protein
MGEIPELMVEPAPETRSARRGEQLEGVLRAGWRLERGARLLGREWVPGGDKGAQDRAEQDVVQAGVRKIGQGLEQVRRDLTNRQGRDAINPAL